MSAVGFEPTRIAPPELESGALDRSAKLTPTFKGKGTVRSARLCDPSTGDPSGRTNNSSDAGTRTRVAWVKARYPNQLDYIGPHTRVEYPDT
jgi:hypothetical protein